MGFIVDVRKIVSKLPVERQTLLFSATMPAGVTPHVTPRLPSVPPVKLYWPDGREVSFLLYMVRINS